MWEAEYLSDINKIVLVKYFNKHLHVKATGGFLFWITKQLQRPVSKLSNLLSYVIIRVFQKPAFLFETEHLELYSWRTCLSLKFWEELL